MATPRVSQERLDAIRRTLQAQVAVRDGAENAMRQPTPQEAAALAGSAAPSATALALPRGGYALRADPSTLSFLIVEQSTDGRLTMRHGSASSVAKPAQGGRDAR